MTIGTHQNIVERRWHMTVRNFTGILAGKPFYVYIESLKAKPVNKSKIMIVALLSIAPSCIMHVIMCRAQGTANVRPRHHPNPLFRYMPFKYVRQSVGMIRGTGIIH